jgi:hypothetical protein|nr:MAG TPA: hypothetical protein [Caudoviricetes sp.]DAV24846.1 MAG TPA: hypothetical protein [Caudoviricetes sp.]
MGCGCGQSIRPKCNNKSAPADFCCFRNDERDVEFIDIDTILPRVTLVAEGVPDSIAIEYIRQAAYTVARESRLLERTIKITLQTGVTDYYLEQGSEQIINVKSVELRDGCCKRKKCFEPLRICDGFRFFPPDKIVLDEPPKVDGGTLEIVYYAAPTQDTCEIDKLLYDRHHDVLVHGALASILMMTKYDFADQTMALMYEKKFNQGISSIKIDVARDFRTGPQSEHPSKYWRKI